MRTLFADTFYFLALLNPKDAKHQKAQDINATPNWRMITTAWILMEVADALATPPNRGLFLRLVDRLQASSTIEVIPLSMDVFNQGLRFYRERPDKRWPLTDCISFVLMQQRGITDALTGDHHFEQAGFVSLMK